MTKFEEWFLPLIPTLVFCQVLPQLQPPKVAKKAEEAEVARGKANPWPQRPYQYQREVVVVERWVRDGKLLNRTYYPYIIIYIYTYNIVSQFNQSAL